MLTPTPLGTWPPFSPGANSTDEIIFAYQRFPSAALGVNDTTVTAGAAISAAANVTDCAKPTCTSSWVVSSCHGLSDVMTRQHERAGGPNERDREPQRASTGDGRRVFRTQPAGITGRMRRLPGCAQRRWIARNAARGR